jgi:hypothetical protein
MMAVRIPGKPGSAELMLIITNPLSTSQVAAVMLLDGI